MKIEKAIVTLEDTWVDDPHFDPERRKAAIKLGIEALKRVSVERTGYERYAPDLLPGETTEDET